MFGFGKKKLSDVIADVASDPIGSAYDGARKLVDEAIEHPGATILGSIVAASLLSDDEEDE